MVNRSRIKIKSLGNEFSLLLTDDVTSAVKSLKRSGYDLEITGHDKSVGLTGYCTVKDKTKFYVIVKLLPDLKSTLKILVHELFHVTQDILEYHGVKFRKGDPNESYAYTIDYLFGEAYEKTIQQHNKAYGTIKQKSNSKRNTRRKN